MDHTWVTEQLARIDPDAVAEVVAEASVVGLGVSTREAREPFQVAVDITRGLVERGFRVLAFLDNPRVVDRYDRYAAGEDVDLMAALGQAWGPWRTREVVEALAWVRGWNARHPGDRVRVIGVGPSRALPGDYDRVLDAAGAPPRVVELFGVIRTAHDAGEHVLRASGTHPGTPFVELAREAQRLLGPLDPTTDALVAGIVEHHANAIGVGYDAEAEERAAANRLLTAADQGVVLWEGSAHVAATGHMAGGHLRRALSTGYAAVHITFGTGHLRGFDVPAPAAGSLEDVLLRAGGPRTLVPAADTPDGPLRTRLIAGVYEPAKDAGAYHRLPSLRAAFDAVVFLPEVTPVRPLPVAVAPTGL
ncbi:erythromycin esterase family protein [Actinokineospora bangkokensis]|nr:erythromycin esterase family protein [Actinokineospora bangkokensis]